MSTPSQFQVRSRDSVDLHVEVTGQGAPMLMCNGLFCSTHYNGEWIRHFSDRYRIVQFDYRGHGRSAEPPHPDRVELQHLVHDAEDVLRATTQSPVVLVGHSMGVRIALDLFCRMPHRVRALILLCGSVFDSLGPIPSLSPLRNLVTGVLGLSKHLGPVAPWIKDKTIEHDLVSPVGYFLGSLSRDLTPREPVQGLLRNVDRIDMRVIRSLGQSYINHSGKHLLPRIHVPTLVVAGEMDSLAPPAHARAVMRKLRMAELHVCSGCTHLAHIEKPDEVHRIVSSFLERRVTP